MGYQVAFAPEGPKVYDRGLAVISKFPIEDSKVEWLTPYNLVFHTRHRFALAVKLRVPSGELRIWNAHLDTRINPEQRLGQLQPVMDEAAKLTGPRLIGGDFNTNDFYWIDHVLPIPHGGGYRSTVRRAMAKLGFQDAVPGSAGHAADRAPASGLAVRERAGTAELEHGADCFFRSSRDLGCVPGGAIRDRYCACGYCSESSMILEAVASASTL